jgi:hypothetical protein
MTNQIATIKPSDEVIKSLSEKGITGTLIEELKKFTGLTVDASINNGTVIFNKDQLDAVSEARKKIKQTRVLIENTCKSMRDEHTKINREISAKEDEMVDVLEPIEKALMAEEKKVEALKQQVRDDEEKAKEQIFRNRVTELEKVGFNSKDFGLKYEAMDQSISTAELRAIDDAMFTNVLKVATEAFNHEQARLAAAEQQRVEAEKKLKEDQEKAAAEQARLDEQRIAQEKKEQELRAEAARIEHEKELALQQKIISRHNQLSAIGLHFDGLFSHEYSEASSIRVKHADVDHVSDGVFSSMLNLLKDKVEKQRAIDAEAERKRIEQEKAEAAEQARLDEIARAKKEAEDKAEQERIAAEQAAKKELRKGDKKKLNELAQRIINIEYPELKSPEANSILNEAITQLKKVADYVTTETKNL